MQSSILPLLLERFSSSSELVAWLNSEVWPAFRARSVARSVNPEALASRARLRAAQIMANEIAETGENQRFVALDGSPISNRACGRASRNGQYLKEKSTGRHLHFVELQPIRGLRNGRWVDANGHWEPVRK